MVSNIGFIRQSNRLIRAARGAYAVRDPNFVLAQKFNSLGAARQWAKRVSFNNNGVKLRIFSGPGFSVSVGISFRNGRRGR